ncbi:MAG: hypothetical protein JSV66_05110 [Trueperaceae bacterium]|nr:MAG: hypothetical protein JSV66_05110 [Trueperaceae bacterium]
MQAGLVSSKYWGSIRGLGGAALIVTLVGLFFRPFSRAVFSEEVRGDVIVQAIPFVAFFVAIILLFILSIALLSIRLHVTVPNRTHRAVELITILGIVAGIVFLFQSWSMTPYRYGFTLLLLSTLSFILWSHIVPRSAKDDASLPAFTRRATTVAVVSGLMVAGILFTGLSQGARPEEPYGMRQRRWDFLDEQQQADIAITARNDYRRVTLPFLTLYSLFPALVVFFVLRESLTPRDEAVPAEKQ